MRMKNQMKNILALSESVCCVFHCETHLMHANVSVMSFQVTENVIAIERPKMMVIYDCE
jgi:hypothetical protein